MIHRERKMMALPNAWMRGMARPRMATCRQAKRFRVEQAPTKSSIATSIFWAPLAICGLVASGAYDAYYMGPEIINARMSATQVRGGIRLRSSACTVFREYGGCFAENPIKVMWGVSSLSDVLFSAEVVYSALFARFAWCVDPRSYTLLAGHVANITVRPGGHGDFVIKKAQNFMCSLW